MTARQAYCGVPVSNNSAKMASWNVSALKTRTEIKENTECLRHLLLAWSRLDDYGSALLWVVFSRLPNQQSTKFTRKSQLCLSLAPAVADSWFSLYGGCVYSGDNGRCFPRQASGHLRWYKWFIIGFTRKLSSRSWKLLHVYMVVLQVLFGVASNRWLNKTVPSTVLR